MSEEIRLVELTRDNWERVAALTVNPGQEGFVAPNLKTIAETRFYPDVTCRVIALGSEPVGLAAYGVDTDDNNWWLFRFMIAGSEQGKGYGRQALLLLIDECLPAASSCSGTNRRTWLPSASTSVWGSFLARSRRGASASPASTCFRNPAQGVGNADNCMCCEDAPL